MARRLELDELGEQFTHLPDEVALPRNKLGPTRLGFAPLLTFLTSPGTFPAGRRELADEPVVFGAGQIDNEPGEHGFHDRASRQIKAHRAEIRPHLDFVECSVTDTAKLRMWLSVCGAERRHDRRLTLRTGNTQQ